MYFLYDLIFIILFIIYTPVLILKMIRGKYREGLLQRFGFLPGSVRDKFKQGPTIWIHAVSVGETVAASPIVSEIKRRFPRHKILFSTVTDTGQKMARKIIQEADGYIYFPLDLSWISKRVLRIIRPELVVIMETELWPNFIKIASDFGIGVMLANGRISDKSAQRYRYLGPIIRDMLKRIDILSMQSEQDVEYILNLGADRERVYNTGNTKFDQSYAQVDPGVKENFYREFKIEPTQPVLVAGSTHPNEEEQLIPVYKRLKSEFADLLMILAPRHITRAAEIEALYQNAGIELVRRTEIEKGDPEKDLVILLDTIGELAQLYSIADLVFVGGSLVEKGGHNILEPAAHGKLVFFGPHMFNFKDNTRLLLEHKVGIQVEDTSELTEKMLYFLKNREELRARGEKAKRMIATNKGAAERTVNLAAELLGVKGHA